MPKRIATQTIILMRDGKRINVKPNTSFEFTKAEIDEINSVSKTALRLPVNESETVVEMKVPEGQVAAVNAALGNSGGITNLAETDANPDASVPAPQGKATSPTTGSKSNPKPTSKSASAEEEL